MADIAHIGLVDAHAEGDGSHHHHAVLAQEAVLVGLAAGRLHAGMIGQRGMAHGREVGGKLFGAFARGAVDDAVLAAAGGDEVADLLAGAGLGHHRQMQVGTVEAAQEQPRRRLPEQPGDDVGAGGRVGGGGQRDGWRCTEFAPHLAQRQVFRAEVMAPLRHAMGLVDGQQADTVFFQHRHGAVAHQPLRRHIQQPQRTVAQAPVDAGAVLLRHRGVERRGIDAVALQGPHLVAHQRDQRRDDDGQPAGQDRRQLVAQRLAAAGRHHRQHIGTAEQRLHDLRLPGAETLETENRMQGGFCRWKCGSRWGNGLFRCHTDRKAAPICRVPLWIAKMAAAREAWGLTAGPDLR